MTTARLGGESQVGQPDLTGRRLIEQVEDLLFGSARARNIKDVLVGEFYHLSDALSGLCRRFRFPSRADKHPIFPPIHP
jgi:hypothetical protein